MAEIWSTAFGRYLRTLRERCSLSLQDVSSLSQGFAETLNKGYLSRCENGRQRLAFSKLIPLSRIYNVEADVLLERLELDMELDRVGSPDSDKMTFAELVPAARDALDHGFRWKAYALLRDASHLARNAPVERYSDADEQVAWAVMNCASAARSLGRVRFALHEFSYVEKCEKLPPRSRPILFERLSQCFRSLGKLDSALEYADAAVDGVQASGKAAHLGFAFANRAQVASAVSDLEGAAKFFKKAYEAYKATDHQQECARSLNNLAQIYFDLGRIRAARRALLAAEGITEPLQQLRSRALGRILMGEIDLLENKPTMATKRWREAADIARELDDKVLRFKAEFQLFKQAHSSGNHPAARSIQRRLLRLSNWIPRGTPELTWFEDLAAERDAS